MRVEHALEVDHPIKMVQLVFQELSQLGPKPLIVSNTLLVEPGQLQPGAAANLAKYVQAGQTRTPPDALIGTRRNYLRIHQDLTPATEINNDDPQRYPHLGRGNPTPVGSRRAPVQQRVVHISGQIPYLPTTGVSDRTSHRAKNGFAELSHGHNTHDHVAYSTAKSPSTACPNAQRRRPALAAPPR